MLNNPVIEMIVNFLTNKTTAPFPMRKDIFAFCREQEGFTAARFHHAMRRLKNDGTVILTPKRGGYTQHYRLRENPPPQANAHTAATTEIK